MSRKGKKLSDSVHLKAKLAGMTDKPEAFHILCPIGSPVAVSSRWSRKEPDLLVEANGGDLHPCLARENPDGKSFHSETVLIL
jgi:hypothetical protein